MQSVYTSFKNGQKEIKLKRVTFIVATTFMIIGLINVDPVEIFIGAILVYYCFCGKIVTLKDEGVIVCNNLIFTKLVVEFSYDRLTDIIIDTRCKKDLKIGFVKDSMTTYAYFKSKDGDDILKFIAERNPHVKVKYLRSRITM